MKPYQRNRITVEFKLDCEKHLCGRCAFRVRGDGPWCNLFRGRQALTDGYRARRLQECKDATVAHRRDPHTKNAKAATVTLNSDDFRRVASELHRAVNVAAEALNNDSANQRDRLRAIVDASSTGLFSLAIGQIRRVSQ